MGVIGDVTLLDHKGSAGFAGGATKRGCSRRRAQLVEAFRGPEDGQSIIRVTGEACTENYTFSTQPESGCKLYGSFIAQGKLSIGTVEGAFSILISEASPTELERLCKALIGARWRPPPTQVAASGAVASGRDSSQKVRPGPVPRWGARKRARPPCSALNPNSLSSRPQQQQQKGGSGVKASRPSATTRGFSPPPRTAAAPPPPAAGAAPSAASQATAAVPPTDDAELRFTPEQQGAIDSVLQGKSIFLSGCAGTGKSGVLKAIIQAVKDAGRGAGLVTTATTWAAAGELNGTTVHMFAGLGGGASGPNINREELVRAVRKRPEVVTRWTRCHTLIVDEISMMDGHVLELLDFLGQQIRGNSRPFGGIQLVLCGDFFQLPPVKDAQQQDVLFCFETRAWTTAVEEVVILSQVFRQKNKEMITILESIRWGVVSQEVLLMLQTCQQQERHRLSKEGQEEEARDSAAGETQLLTHRADVDRINQAELNKLAGDEVEFSAIDEGSPHHRRQLDTACVIPKKISLKVGAEVLLHKTIKAKRVTKGARGVVVRFTGGTAGSRLPVVRFKKGVEVVIEKMAFPLYASGGSVVSARRRQLPLQLAWGISIHRSQGMSLDKVAVSLQRVFEAGQAYVALSRARSLKGLRVVGKINPRAIRAHPKVVDFYTKLGCKPPSPVSSWA